MLDRILKSPRDGALLTILLMLPSLVWAWQDRHLWPWDQAWYGETATTLYYTLTRDPLGWLAAMQAAMPLKPPLLAWLGQFFVPIGVMTRDVEFGLLFVSILAHTATLFLVFLTVRRLTDTDWRPAVLAVLLTASAPLFVGTSHQFLTEPLQTLVVTVSMYLATISRELRWPRVVLYLTLLFFIALSIKTTTFIYCGPFWLIAVIDLLTAPNKTVASRNERRTDQILLAITVLTIGLVVAWYARNFEQVLRHISNVLNVEVAKEYGSLRSYDGRVMFWTGGFNYSMFLVSAVFPITMAAAVGFTIFDVIRNGVTSLWQRRIEVACLVQVCTIFLMMTAQVMEETRFIEAVIPCFAVIVAMLLWRLGGKPAVYAAMAAASLQFVFVHAMAHGLTANTSQSAWLLPRDRNNVHRQNARQVIKNSCPKKLALRYTILAPELPTMNANSMAFEGAKSLLRRGHRCYYTSLGYGETKLETALQRLDTLRATHVVLPREPFTEKDENFLNKTVNAVRDAVRKDERFELMNTPLVGYDLYRRRDPNFK
ncbi:MAG: ArnT family glycosyltransferase [Hyphomicrobium sp.]